MAECTWCGVQAGYDDLKPVQLYRHTMVDGEPSDEEMAVLGPLPIPDRAQYAMACPTCIETERFKEPTKAWLTERKERERRAENAMRRRVGAPEIPWPEEAKKAAERARRRA